MPDTETVTPDQLGLILMAHRSAAPINFSALTSARLRKTGNPYGDVHKLKRVQAFTGTDYEAAVRREQEREGQAPTFEAKPRAWGHRLSSALVRHPTSGDLYLAAQVLRKSRPTYLYKTGSGYWRPISREKIAPFLPPEHSAADAQGVEREVKRRDYRLDSLVSVRFDRRFCRVRRT